MKKNITFCLFAIILLLTGTDVFGLVIYSLDLMKFGVGVFATSNNISYTPVKDIYTQGFFNITLLDIDFIETRFKSGVGLSMGTGIFRSDTYLSLYFLPTIKHYNKDVKSIFTSYTQNIHIPYHVAYSFTLDKESDHPAMLKFVYEYRYSHNTSIELAYAITKDRYFITDHIEDRINNYIYVNVEFRYIAKNWTSISE